MIGRVLAILGPAAIAAIAATLLATTAGCVTERVESDSARPMPPQPRPAPAAPATARANRMALMVLGPKPIDTDGNGRPDTIPIEVFLFAEPHPTPIFEDGAFVFDLYMVGEAGTNEDPIVTWRFESDTLAGHRARGMVGPMHRFSLSLLEQGGDDLGLAAVDLVGSFEPADGRRRIRSTGARTIQMTPGTGAASAR